MDNYYFIYNAYAQSKGNHAEIFQSILNEKLSYLVEPKEICALRSQLNNMNTIITGWELKEKLRKQVLFLKDIPQPEQRTKAWYDLRHNMFTASSDIGVITGDSYDHKKTKDKQYLIDKLLLKKNGCDLEGFKGNDLTRYGNKYEEVVSRIYQDKVKTPVWEFGLIQHQTVKCVGASPDGITPTGRMLEIKCPQMRKINGIVPQYYWSQMQVQLEVCDLEECDFVECVFNEITEEEADISTAEYTGTMGEMYNCTCNNKDDLCECYNDPENRIFIYPTISTPDFSDKISVSAQRHEIKHIYNTVYAHKYKFKRFCYYVLLEYSCVLVYRDREWWNKHLQNIKDTWDKVIELRNNPKKKDKLLEKTKMHTKKNLNEYNSEIKYAFSESDTDL